MILTLAARTRTHHLLGALYQYIAIYCNILQYIEYLLLDGRYIEYYYWTEAKLNYYLLPNIGPILLQYIVEQLCK